MVQPRSESCRVLFELSSSFDLGAGAFAPEFELGLLTADEVPEAAKLLVTSFADSLHEPAACSETIPQPPAGLWPSPTVDLRSETREELAQRGLEWRMGVRLSDPSLGVSLEQSLMLALRERREGGQLAACAELAMRPVDGTLPTDFAVPAVFQLHQAPLAPHLYNLAVAPQFRRQKMASRLISTAERVVRLEWRQKELYLHVDVKNNPGAAALYREQAFDPLPDFDNLADVRLGERQTTALHRYHRKRLALPDGAVGTVDSNNALSRHRNTSMV